MTHSMVIVIVAWVFNKYYIHPSYEINTSNKLMDTICATWALAIQSRHFSLQLMPPRSSRLNLRNTWKNISRQSPSSQFASIVLHVQSWPKKLIEKPKMFLLTSC